MIKVINDMRNIKTIFIPQLLNKQKLTSATAYGWLPMVADKDVWALQLMFNKILFEKFNNTIYINYENFQDQDFVDNGHFSSKGAAKFANMISNQIQQKCKGS